MIKGKISLGIDTSNYKTSVALVSQGGEILLNSRSFLEVKKGERGLRQSEAFFQHVVKLPKTVSEALSDPELRQNIGCIAVSDRPRPKEGSYMPVFSAGTAFAKVLSAALDVPLFTFSHQEGHVEAVRYYSEVKDTEPFICFHFSGGTTEAVLADKNNKRFGIVGGTKDISYGQVLDRIGVAMGFGFPCGENIDELASSCGERTAIFTPLKVRNCFVNLSGIETQGQRILSAVSEGKKAFGREQIACDLMFNICGSVEAMTMQLSEKYDIKNFIFAGGVSSSVYLRTYMSRRLKGRVNCVFGDPELSQDNAVGTALLGGSKIWL